MERDRRTFEQKRKRQKDEYPAKTENRKALKKAIAGTIGTAGLLGIAGLYSLLDIRAQNEPVIAGVIRLPNRREICYQVDTQEPITLTQFVGSLNGGDKPILGTKFIWDYENGEIYILDLLNRRLDVKQPIYRNDGTRLSIFGNAIRVEATCGGENK